MCHPNEFGCDHPAHHSSWGIGHHPWGCCCVPGYPPQRFPTREEIIGQLEQYLGELQAEAKGVGERIAELRKGDS